ncbi:helix-turn-helix domain-containing protein [Parasphingorhabdus pacifica]
METSEKRLVNDESNRPEPSLGRLLARYRKFAGWTQEELAAESGVSVRAISNIERRRTRGPQQHSVEALSEALALTGSDRERLLQSARHGRRRSATRESTGHEHRSWPIGTLFSAPNPLGALIGRGTELGQLLNITRMTTGSTSHGPVAIVSGLPGVGKTRLATALAQEGQEDFPDGRLFVDLRGTDERPLAPYAVLERLLRAATASDPHIPRELDERASLWRWLVGDRRMLLVLDNASDEAQVRPLIPGGHHCTTLVTSRRSLTGIDSTHRMQLDVLAPHESVALLTDVIGDARVHIEQAAIADIAALCGDLPLALRIAANKLTGQPQWTVRHLADRLDDPRQALSALVAGDIQMRSAFTASYRTLDSVARMVFRRLGLVPAPTVTAPLAGAAAGLDLWTAEEALATLADNGMLQLDTSTGCYRIHHLARTFAAERLSEEDSEAAIDAAAERVRAEHGA